MSAAATARFRVAICLLFFGFSAVFFAVSPAWADVILDENEPTSSHFTISGGGLTIHYIGSSEIRGAVPATASASSGKWYWEQHLDTYASNRTIVGLVAPASTDWDASSGVQPIFQNHVYYYKGNGSNEIRVGNGGDKDILPVSVPTYGAGDTIGVAFDADLGAVWVSKNGTWLAGASASEIEAGDTSNAVITGLSGDYTAYFPGGVKSSAGNYIVTFAFSDADLAYTPPGGFQAYGNLDSSGGDPDPDPEPKPGDEEDEAASTIGYEYDDVGRLKAVRYFSSGIQYRYEYDDAGNRLNAHTEGLDVPSVQILDASGTEGEPISFTLTLDSPAGAGASVDWATLSEIDVAQHKKYTGGPGYARATPETDYPFPQGTRLDIPEGATSVTITVDTAADVEAESGEVLIVQLSNPINAQIDPDFDAGLGTILDDDLTAFTVVADKLQIGGSETVTYTVTRTAETDLGALPVTFELRDGTAVVSSDLGAPSLAGHTFNTLDEVQTVTVTSAASPAGGTFTFAVVGDSAGVPVDYATVITEIAGNGPSFSVDDVSVDEGGVLLFTVTKSHATAIEYSVEYITAPLLAESNDYEHTFGTLYFAPEELTKTVEVQTVDDDRYEPDDGGIDTVELKLDEASAGATISDGSGVGTITNSIDSAPTFTIVGRDVVEGGVLLFDVTLSHSSEVSQSLAYYTTDGTATVADNDYEPQIDKSIVLLTGVTDTTIQVQTTADNKEEADETVQLTITELFGDQTVLGTATAKILNDDETPPSFSVSDTSVTEGGDLQFVVTKSHETVGTYGFNWRSAPGTADDNDFNHRDGQYNFAGGEMSRTFTIETVDDERYEPDNGGVETIEFIISNPTNGATISRGTAIGSITNSQDSAPTFSIVSTNATEGGKLIFEVFPSNSKQGYHSFYYETSNGTASSNDYTATSGVKTFPGSNASTTIEVSTNDDSAEESNETVRLTLYEFDGSVGGQITSKTATIIDDDDNPPSFSVSNASVTEGGDLVFTITKSHTTSGNYTVGYGTSGGTAEGDDYTPEIDKTVTFSGSETSKTVRVSTSADNVYEPEDNGTDTVELNLRSVSGDGTISDGRGIGTINDNDSAPHATVSATGTSEGGSLKFKITLSNPSERIHRFDYEISLGTASSNDVSGFSATGYKNISAGATSSTVSVSTVNDGYHEPTETVNFKLTSSNGGATYSSSSKSANINDNDPGPSIRIGDATASEGGTLSFEVSLIGCTRKPHYVNYSTANGTAIASYDYSPKSGRLAWSPSDTCNRKKTITVSTIEDQNAENTELVYVDLSGATHEASISDGRGKGTINDDD